MKYFKLYEEFSNKTENITFTINEGFIEKIKNFFNIDNIKHFLTKENGFRKLLTFFTDKFGKKGWFYNLLYLKHEGLLKYYGVEIYDPEYKLPNDININENFLFNIESISEAKVPLTHPDSMIYNVKPTELADEIKMRYKIQLDSNVNSPLFIWGAPGIGKTDVVKQVCKDLNLTAIIIDLSIKDPVDFIGIPYREETGTKFDKDQKKDVPDFRTKFAAPQVFPNEGQHDKGGIVFLDEMNRANPSVLNASLQFVLNRKLENYELPHNWIIVAAANRKGIDDIEMSEIGKALGNRFGQVNLYTTPKEWIDWARSPKATLTDKNDKSTGEYYVSDELMAFLSFYEDLFHNLDLDQETSVYPTPRAWSRAAKIYYATKKIKPNITKEETARIFSLEVGVHAANTFIAFLDLIKTIDTKKLELVYTNPEKAPLIDKIENEQLKKDNPELYSNEGVRPDLINGLITLIVSLRKGKLSTKEFINLINYAKRLTAFEYANLLIKEVYQYHKKDLDMNDPSVESALQEFTERFKHELDI